MNFLFEPGSLVQVIVNCCLIGLKGTVFEVLCLFFCFFILLCDSMFFPGELVDLLLEVAYLS